MFERVQSAEESVVVEAEESMDDYEAIAKENTNNLVSRGLFSPAL